MRNIKLTIEYDGTDFAGWQRQPLTASQGKKQRTIQDRIETALKQLLNEEIELVGAGRTDAGVHAHGQVANFHTASPIEVRRLKHALNSVLPADVKVRQAEDVPEDFHARFDASERVYRYFISTERSAILRRYTGFYSYDLDLNAMDDCGKLLIGRHDFGAFCRVKAQTKTKVCTVRKAQWYQMHSEGRTSVLFFEIAADRYLHAMVRIIVGNMIKVGMGEFPVREFQRIFESRDVKQAAGAARAEGLFLWRIQYDLVGGRKPKRIPLSQQLAQEALNETSQETEE